MAHAAPMMVITCATATYFRPVQELLTDSAGLEDLTGMLSTCHFSKLAESPENFQCRLQWRESLLLGIPMHIVRSRRHKYYLLIYRDD